MLAFTAELTRMHEEVVAKQIHVGADACCARVAIVVLAGAAVATTAVAS